MENETVKQKAELKAVVEEVLHHLELSFAHLASKGPKGQNAVAAKRQAKRAAIESRWRRDRLVGVSRKAALDLAFELVN
jgi:hypothetical protein